MATKPLSVQLPEDLMANLNKVVKRTGRNKTLLIKVSLTEFLRATEERQEQIIRNYLNTDKGNE